MSSRQKWIHKFKKENNYILKLTFQDKIRIYVICEKIKFRRFFVDFKLLPFFCGKTEFCDLTQLAINCLKLKVGTLKQGVEYVKS